MNHQWTSGDYGFLVFVLGFALFVLGLALFIGWWAYIHLVLGPLRGQAERRLEAQREKLKALRGSK